MPNNQEQKLMRHFLGGFASIDKEECGCDHCPLDNEDAVAETEVRYIYVLASSEMTHELDSLEEAKELLEELSDEGIVNPLDCVVYKVPFNNIYEVKQNLELVLAQE